MGVEINRGCCQPIRGSVLFGEEGGFRLPSTEGGPGVKDQGDLGQGH